MIPIKSMPFPLARAVATAFVMLSGAIGAQAAPTWITVGDEAYALLRQATPEARTLASRQVSVTVPERRGSLTLVQGSENVHAVEVDDEALPALTEAVHEQLRRCGGYIRHESMAEALAVLHRLELGTRAARVAPTPSYAIDDVAQVNAMLPQMQASNILSTIESLSAFQNRRYNSSHGVAASNWLFNQWSQMSQNRRDVRVRQITHAGWPQKSVSFEIDGTSSSGETIVIGAHLDSISSGGTAETQRAPGADDDASGVASMTEVIRVLLANRYLPKRSLRFVAYAAEEVGLLGSQQVAASYQAERKVVVGVMQLDMTAYKGSNTDLWIFTDYTNAAQNQFVADLAAAYLPQLTVGYDRCGYGCSDHASWHNRGYAASFPFEASFSTDNPTIHTPNDTIATFGSQANHALKFSQLALAFAVELSSDDTPALRASR